MRHPQRPGGGQGVRLQSDSMPGRREHAVFEEAELVLVCRKLFVQDMDPACVRDERIFASYGEKGGWHRIYTGEVLEAYCKS